MSLNAFIWAARLPMDVCSASEYRVLVLLADHAHEDGRNAFRNTEKMATELGCSQRTVQRALSGLLHRGLIKRGDQSITQNNTKIRADQRPTVYDLNLRYGLEYTQPAPLDGMTTAVAANGMTEMSRYDRNTPNGMTTAVAQGTVLNQPVKSSRGNHTAPVVALCPKGHPLDVISGTGSAYCAFGCPAGGDAA